MKFKLQLWKWIEMPHMSKCGEHLTTSPTAQFSKCPALTSQCWGEWGRKTWCQSKEIVWLLSHPLQSPIEPGRGEMIYIAQSWRLMAHAAPKPAVCMQTTWHTDWWKTKDVCPGRVFQQSLISIAICTAKARSNRSQRNQQSHDKNAKPQTK